jgi:hypothetical protein
VERVGFIYESESDCTGEMGLGQFNIFGAIEENNGREISGIPRIK